MTTRKGRRRRHRRHKRRRAFDRARRELAKRMVWFLTRPNYSFADFLREEADWERRSPIRDAIEPIRRERYEAPSFVDPMKQMVRAINLIPLLPDGARAVVYQRPGSPTFEEFQRALREAEA